MKRQLMTIAMAVMMITCFAQTTTVSEPEFIGDVIVLNADGTTTPLPKESMAYKTSTTKFGYIPIPGSVLLDKAKSNLEVKGPAAETKIKTTRLEFIIRADGNDMEPRTAFVIMKFETKKKKRFFTTAEAKVLGGATASALNTLEWTAEKYGENSYKVVMDNIEPGQYGITLDRMNVATFEITE